MRMNISVPDDLAEQVRTLDLPISGICQKALGSAVEDAERKAAFVDDLDAVVERLRGTVDAENAEKAAQKAEGREDGITWAKEYATVGDLEGLADGEADGLHPHSPTLRDFFRARKGWTPITLSSPVPVDVVEDEEYWDGFMIGAIQVWEAVCDRI